MSRTTSDPEPWGFAISRTTESFKTPKVNSSPPSNTRSGQGCPTTSLGFGVPPQTKCGPRSPPSCSFVSFQLGRVPACLPEPDPAPFVCREATFAPRDHAAAIVASQRRRAGLGGEPGSSSTSVLDSHGAPRPSHACLVSRRAGAGSLTWRSWEGLAGQERGRNVSRERCSLLFFSCF